MYLYIEVSRTSLKQVEQLRETLLNVPFGDGVRFSTIRPAGGGPESKDPMFYITVSPVKGDIEMLAHELVRLEKQ